MDALGLCLTSLGTEPPGRACRKSPGQSPALVARWVLLGPGAAGSGQQAGALTTLLQLLPPTERVAKRLKTHSYFGRAFGPHLHVYFFFVVPSVEPSRAQMSHQTKIDSIRAALCGQTFSCSRQSHVPLPRVLWEDVWKKCQGVHFSLDLSGWSCGALMLEVNDVINKDAASGQARPCSPNRPSVLSPQMLRSTGVPLWLRLCDRKVAIVSR